MGGLLKFITCGSVDDGKSTLIGHILYDAKLLYADMEQALLLDSQLGSRSGDIDYSLLLDGLMAEREQGITIDVAYRYFSTDARSFIVADTPGHEEYTRNMAVGASFAELAVILVDAKRGVQSQTRRHARICAMMGIRDFVFAVNKMDLVGFDQATFDAIRRDIEELSESLSLENRIVIPLSATEGDNLTSLSSRMPWYAGPHLLEYLETVDIDATTTEKGFILPVQRVCRPDHTFRGFQGQVESGELEVGHEVRALPSGETAVVKALFLGDRAVDRIEKGQPVTVQLDREVDLSRGCVLTREAGLHIARAFSGDLLWMDDEPLVVGGEYWIKIGTNLLPARVAAVTHRVEVNTGECLPAAAIGKNEIARCEIGLTRNAVLDRFSAHKTMGEFLLIDRISHATVACGVIGDIIRTEAEGAVFEDGDASVTLDLFDVFSYRTDLHAVVRKRPARTVYRVGDDLPLTCAGYDYPDNFDVSLGDRVLRVRNGRFAGFGSREDGVSLLNERGLGLDGGAVEPYEKYRSILVEHGGGDYEI